MVPAYYITVVEVNLGIVFACGPAIRQFWAYKTRTHTSLPSTHRQSPNEDFEKMRFRINVRDILWYRKAQMVGNRVFDATPAFRSKPPVPSASSKSTSQVRNSVLDVWEKKIMRLFGTHHNQKVPFQVEAYAHAGEKVR